MPDALLTIHFCTYLDSGYLSRGLALYTSLVEHVPDFHLHVLCLDPLASKVFDRLRLSRLSIVPLSELEKADPSLTKVRPTRTQIEYYFTITPAWIRMALERSDGLITYVDADVHLFGHPERVLSAMGEAAITIVPHDFPPSLSDRRRYGTFNVGWLSFVADERSRDVLRTWRDQCIEWCYDRVEGERFADQKYLDAWPNQYQFVQVTQERGVNVGPWNVSTRHIDNQMKIDGESLISYHFHGVHRAGHRLYDPGLAGYGVPLTRVLRSVLYEPYIRRIASWERLLPYEAVSGSNLRNQDVSPRLHHRVQNGLTAAIRRVSGDLIRVPRTVSDPVVDRVLAQ